MLQCFLNAFLAVLCCTNEGGFHISNSLDHCFNQNLFTLGMNCFTAGPTAVLNGENTWPAVGDRGFGACRVSLGDSIGF